MNSRFFKTLGPGILFASTAIGVSHLVQSTTAGAEYGFTLLWAVLAANILKFPFFEYGCRYANVTKTSLIDGYAKMGKAMLILYFVVTIVSMLFVTAAVGAVTAGFMDNLFGISNAILGGMFPTFLVFGTCFLLLSFGRFGLLDKLIKVIGIVLVISTLVAFVIALNNGPQGDLAIMPKVDPWSMASVPFLLALMGWMPTAVDLSTWNSLWTLERIKQSGYKPSLKETLVEFNIGYWASAVLGVCFVTLGAFLIYDTSNTMPNGTAAFANRVIHLYTETIGQWSYLIIAAAGFSIMFGTTIGVFDGYARSFERTIELLFLKNGDPTENRRIYVRSLAVVALGGFVLIWLFQGNPKGFKALVNAATILSFIIAPIIAVANFYLVMKTDQFKGSNRPSLFLQILSYLGLIFLFGFSGFYLYYLLFI